MEHIIIIYYNYGNFRHWNSPYAFRLIIYAACPHFAHSKQLSECFFYYLMIYILKGQLQLQLWYVMLRNINMATYVCMYSVYDAVFQSVEMKQKYCTATGRQRCTAVLRVGQKQQVSSVHKTTAEHCKIFYWQVKQSLCYCCSLHKI